MVLRVKVLYEYRITQEHALRTRISDEALDEFIAIYKEEFMEEISPIDVSNSAFLGPIEVQYAQVRETWTNAKAKRSYKACFLEDATSRALSCLRSLPAHRVPAIIR
jgi:hypothetical protein